MNHIKLILEQIENDSVLAGTDEQKQETLDEVASAIAHVTQKVAHKLAGKYASSDDEYIQIIKSFVGVVHRKIDQGAIKPEGINLKMISDEFNKIINKS